MNAFSLNHALQFLLLAQSGLLGLFLASRRVLWPLAVFLGLLALHMAFNLGAAVGGWDFPSPTPAFAFSYGPLSLALVRHLAWKARRPLTWPHLIPALVALALPTLLPGVWNWVWPSIYLSLGGYLICSVLELKRFRRTLRATRSESEGNNLGWLDEALWILIVLAAFDFFKQWLAPKWGIQSSLLSNLNIGGACGFVWFLVWRGLQQSKAFTGLSLEEADLASLNTSVPFVSPSNPPRELTTLHARLLDHMAGARPFLDPELSLQSLADQLRVAPRQLSMAINQVGGLNFNDFINGYRVDAAQALLRNPARQGDKLLAIQFEAGFASKSVFNAVFKKVTGQTPSAYRLQNLDSGRPET